MSRELDPSLKSLALQIAVQLPDDQREAISVLRYAREIVQRPEQINGKAQVGLQWVKTSRGGSRLPQGDRSR
jgi:hypothetical protein